MPLVGDKLVLTLMLFDGATDKYVKARVFDADGIELPSSPVTLTHFDDGLYTNDDLFMPNSSYVTAAFIIFDDALLTTESELHARTQVTYERENPPITPISPAIPALTGIIGDQELKGDLILPPPTPLLELTGSIQSNTILGGVEKLQELAGAVNRKTLTGEINNEC